MIRRRRRITADELQAETTRADLAEAECRRLLDAYKADLHAAIGTLVTASDWTEWFAAKAEWLDQKLDAEIQDRDLWAERAIDAEGKFDELRERHRPHMCADHGPDCIDDDDCVECGEVYPCSTIRLIGAPA